MKKTITEERDICDVCQTEEAYYKCLRCGKEYGFQCREAHVVTYNHAVYFQGSGDGDYCKPCDIALHESKDDPLHQAYFQINLLREESERFYADWKIRCERAEQRVKELS